MKICFFSDIHGNYEAFSVGYKLLLAEHADLNIFLGDICGYYFDCIKIWAELKECPNLVTLLGNHDKFFLKNYHIGTIPVEYTQKYGPSLNMLLHSCSNEFIEWLENAESSFADESEALFCCHGGPNDVLNQYIYPDSELPVVNAKYVVMGHTHYSMYRFQHGCHYGNPGSMGQPRDGSAPSFAVLRTEQNGSWDIHHFSYDKTPLFKAMKEMRVPEYLRQVLRR